MIRRPPRATRTDTLFPYTTLFRSGYHAPARRIVRLEQFPPCPAPERDGEFGESVDLVAPTRITDGCLEVIPKVVHPAARSEEHTSELQSLIPISYAVFCSKKHTTTAMSIYHHRALPP